MSSFEAAILRRLATTITSGMNTATAAVLLMKAESRPTVAITTTSAEKWLRP